jgi:hypothetical protein
MCTLSFSPSRNGLLLAMNRDESLARETALAPRIFSVGDTRAIYPSETNGGTWLAVNDRALVLALLNRNGQPGHKKQRSRGVLIPSLITARSLVEVEDRLRSSDTSGILPFIVLAFDGSVCSISQTIWDGQAISTESLPWTARHWFSSSLSDEDATLIRGRTCDVFREHFVSSPESLRELHRSHSPGAGPFSICVHRPDVGTVSYSEIEVAGGEITFSYAAGTPCQRGPLNAVGLALASYSSSAA